MPFQTHLNRSLVLHKDRIAIESSQGNTTYESILARSQKITQHLLAQGLGAETLVGLDVTNKVDLICSMIGVINAGCVFVILDPSLPSQRLEAMMEDLGLEYLICSEGSSPYLSKLKQAWRYQEILAQTEMEQVAVSPDFDGEDSLYIYFTSGSSGTPKGIVGKNRSLLQFLQWEIKRFKLNENSRVSQLISPYFDAFLRDVFAPLLAGGTICLPPAEEDFLSPENLIPWIDEKEISLIHCVPSLFQLINDPSLSAQHFPKLRYVLMSGEKIIPSSLKHWYSLFSNRIQLVNLYGLTETTMIRASYFISPQDANKARIPIGMPIDDTEFLIAKKDFKACNTLITGDLYIISPYLSKGYLNNPELTAEKFLRLPNSDKLAVKTGDKARRLPDGNIELIGREDRQVKLRGIRIELDEIETVLAKADSINKQAVIVRTDASGNEVLLGFVLPDAHIDPAEIPAFKDTLYEHLGRHLPDYMIPVDLILLDSFPLLPNGKLDYKGLAEYQVQRKPLLKPEGKVEQELLEIWREILGIEEISTDDRFHEIGGNSLTIMKLIGRLNKKYGVRLSLSELFNNPSIKQQATCIEKQGDKSQIIIPKASPKDYYPLTPAQRQMYFIYELDKDSIAYNIPGIYVIKGNLDQDKIGSALHALTYRHEGLRSSFKLIDGEPRQIINEKGVLDIELFDKDEREIEAIIHDFVRPFTLDKAPLARVGLIPISPEEHILMLDMHHIIFDGKSESIFIRELAELYQGKQLPGLTIQYRDYIDWTNSTSQIVEQDKLKKFWNQQFSELSSPLELPSDFSRPIVSTRKGNHIGFELDENLTNQLKDICTEEGISMYMLLLAIFNIFLSKLTQKEDITIGTVISGRNHVDLENVLGLFINSIPLRNHPQGKLTFRSFLANIKSSTLAFFDHQNYPYQDLINDLKVDRNSHRNPLFNHMFVFQNSREPDLNIPELKICPYKRENVEAKFDLTLNVTEGETTYHLTFE
ncbi:MAG: amino acid adenylation domain-containing protein, partial [Bacteroidota bacterium]